MGRKEILTYNSNEVINLSKLLKPTFKFQSRCHNRSLQKVEDLDIVLQTPRWMYFYKRWSSLLAWFWWSTNQWNHTIPLISNSARKECPASLQIQPFPLGKMSSCLICTSINNLDDNVSSLIVMMFWNSRVLCFKIGVYLKDNLGDGRRSNIITTIFGTWCYQIWDPSKSSIAFKFQK
jgi:hypothetical protein